MAAYLIVDTLLNDPDLYEQYKLKARPLSEKFGGKYLARRGRMTRRETDLWSPTRLVLVRFSDVETANRCLDSLEYQQILPISKQSARRTAIVLDGEEVDERCLPKLTVEPQPLDPGSPWSAAAPTGIN